jgi:hypothetical protein
MASKVTSYKEYFKIETFIYYDNHNNHMRIQKLNQILNSLGIKAKGRSQTAQELLNEVSKEASFFYNLNLEADR